MWTASIAAVAAANAAICCIVGCDHCIIPLGPDAAGAAAICVLAVAVVATAMPPKTAADAGTVDNTAAGAGVRASKLGRVAASPPSRPLSTPADRTGKLGTGTTPRTEEEYGEVTVKRGPATSSTGMTIATDGVDSTAVAAGADGVAAAGVMSDDGPRRAARSRAARPRVSSVAVARVVVAKGSVSTGVVARGVVARVVVGTGAASRGACAGGGGVVAITCEISEKSRLRPVSGAC